MHDFFPIQSGPPFWSRSVHRTDLVKIRPISRDLPSNPLPTPPARPPRHRPCAPRLPSGGASTAGGRWRAQAGAGGRTKAAGLRAPRQLVSLGCVQKRAPPTGQFGCVQTPATANLGVSKRFGCVQNGPLGARLGAPQRPPRPQGRPTGVRDPARARRAQNISLLKIYLWEGW